MMPKSLRLPLLLAVGLLCWQSAGAFLQILGPWPSYAHGLVAMRGVVTDADGHIVLAEYDSNGHMLGVVNLQENGLVSADAIGASVLDRATYNLYGAALQGAMESLQTLSPLRAAGMTVVSSEQYAQSDFQTFHEPQQAVVKPALNSSTRSVLLVGPMGLLQPGDNPVAYESPIDFTLSPVSLPEGVRSVLVNTKGELIYASEHNIGPYSSYLQAKVSEQEVPQEGSSEALVTDYINSLTVPEGCTVERAYPEETSRFAYNRYQDAACAPQRTAPIYLYGIYNGTGGGGLTDKNGRFAMEYLNMPCPGFAIEYSYPLVQEAAYTLFNPRAMRPYNVFYQTQWTHDTCDGSEAHLLYSQGISGLMTYISSSLTRDLAVFAPNEYNFFIDAVALTGRVKLYNVGGVEESEIPRGETRYNPGSAAAPADTLGTGLLQQLSAADLANTDVYVFRNATGQLVAQKEGLREGSDYNSGDEKNTLYLAMLLPIGPQRVTELSPNPNYTGDPAQDCYNVFDEPLDECVPEFITGETHDLATLRLFVDPEWTSDSDRVKPKIDESFLFSNSDILRVGEGVTVVVINRATGYLGMKSVALSVVGGGNINVRLGEIAMSPPNLKVYAERWVAGSDGSATQTQIPIANESSAAINDSAVAITTEWYGPKGEMLPALLPGMSGRIAKSSSLGASSGAGLGAPLAHFAIRPGRHLALVRMNGADLADEHYYIHASGEPYQEGNLDMGSELGAGEGLLALRPRHYAPMQVRELRSTLRVSDPETGFTAGSGTLWSPTGYLTQLARYEAVLEQNQGSADFAGAYLLTRDEYESESTQFYSLEVDEEGNHWRIDKPSLPSGVTSLLVRGADALFTRQTDPRLYLSLVDLTVEEPALRYPSAEAASVLLDDDGRIAAEYQYAWGYRPEFQFSVFELAVRNDFITEAASQGANTTLLTLYELANDSTALPGYLDERVHVLITNGRVDYDSQGELINAALPSELDTSTYPEYADYANAAYVASVDDLLLTNPDGQTLLAMDLIQSSDPANTLFNVVALPLVLAAPSEVTLSRMRNQGTWNPDVANAVTEEITDSYMLFNFYLTDAARVRVELQSDTGATLATLVPTSDLAAGAHLFLTTYEEIQSKGVAIRKGGADFRIELVAEQSEYDPSVVLRGTRHRVRWPGELREEENSEMLGNVVIDDIHTQRGELQLQSAEYHLPGLGPNVDLMRSYGHFRQVAGVMGQGWSHSAGFTLQPIKFGDNSGDNNLPEWVMERQGAFFDDVPQNEEPWMVTVSGFGMFIKRDGSWKSQRGHVATLSQDASQWVVRNKDGTRVVFPMVAVAGDDEAAKEIRARGTLYASYQQDRSGNRVDYTYEPYRNDEGEYDMRLTQMHDAIDRQFDFIYRDLPMVPVAAMASESDEQAVSSHRCWQNGYSEWSLMACGMGDNNGQECSETERKYPCAAAYKPRLVQVRGPLDLMVEYKYDEHGQLYLAERGDSDAVVTAPAARTYTYHYERHPEERDIFRVVEALSPTGNSKHYSYSKSTQMQDRYQLVDAWVATRAEFADASAFSVEYLVDSAKRVVTDPEGKVTTYTFNYFGNPIKVERPLGHTTEYTWAIDEGKPHNVVTRMLDELGRETTYEYDAYANLTHTYYPDGSEEVDEWEPNFGHILSQTDRNGYTTRYEYNATGDLIGLTDAGNQRTDFAYYANGRLKSRTDARDNTTEFYYDSHGFLNKTVIPGTPPVTLEETWNLRGYVVRSTNGIGNWSECTHYDPLDNCTALTNPRGTHITKYNADGQVAREVYRNGLTFQSHYDNRDQLVSVERSGDNIETATKHYAYDHMGNMTEESDWRGHSNYFFFDDLYRRVKVVDRQQQETRATFVAASDRLQSLLDPMGRLTTYTYDSSDYVQQVRVTRGDEPALITEYVNDYEGNITRITDPEGRITEFTYTPTGLSDTVTKKGVQLYSLASNGDYLTEVSSSSYDLVTQYVYDATYNLVRIEYADGSKNLYAYNSANQMVRLEQEGDPANEYAYNAAGLLSLVRSANGEETTIEYNDINRIERVTLPVSTALHANAATMQYLLREYDEVGQMTKESNELGDTREMTYDALGNLRTLKLPGWSGVATYGYDANDNMVEENDPHGLRSIYTFDSMDRLTATITAGGSAYARSQSTTYHYDGSVDTQTDGRGQVTEFDYDLNGSLNRVKLPGGATIQYVNDRVGNVLRVTDELDRVRSVEYDALDRPVINTDTNQTKSYFAYDIGGNLVASSDAMGLVSRTHYDATDRITDTWVGTRRINAIEYDAFGNITRVTDALDHVTEFEYDNFGNTRLTRQIGTDTDDFATLETRTEYDSQGRVAAEYDELGREVARYTYDGRGNLLTAFNPQSGESVSSTYSDGDLLLTSIRDNHPSGSVTTFTYTPYGELETAQDADHNRVVYRYDENGNLSAQADAMGNSVTYAYDVRDQLEKIYQHTTDAQGNPVILTTRMEYDPAGNLKLMVSPAGVTQSVTAYNPQNLPTEITWSGHTSPYTDFTSVKFDYNGVGMVTKRTEAKVDRVTGTTFSDVYTYGFNAQGDLQGMTQNNTPFSYQFNAVGDPTGMTTPGGSTQWAYDSYGRVASTTGVGGTTTNHYYRTGELKRKTYPNGSVAEYGVDSEGRVTQVVNRNASGTVASQFDYHYDPAGDLTQEVEQLGARSWTHDYAYSPAQLLKRIETTNPDGSKRVTEYQHDANGNRLQDHIEELSTVGLVVAQIENSYTYDALNHLTAYSTTLGQSTSYLYDLDGNLVEEKAFEAGVLASTRQYGYNSRHWLVEIKALNSAGEGTVLSRFDYNNDGDRTLHYGSSRGDIRYLYALGAVSDEIDAHSGNLLAHYTSDDEGPIAMHYDNRDLFYSGDQQGSTTALTDSNGATEVEYRVDSWGNLQEQSGESFNRRLYSGKEYDDESGLYYYGARFYDPKIGRFLTQDTVTGDAQRPYTLNRYAFGNGNPVMNMDPDGHFAFPNLLALGRITQGLLNFSRSPVLRFGGFLRSGASSLATKGLDLLSHTGSALRQAGSRVASFSARSWRAADDFTIRHSTAAKGQLLSAAGKGWAQAKGRVSALGSGIKTQLFMLNKRSIRGYKPFAEHNFEALTFRIQGHGGMIHEGGISLLFEYGKAGGDWSKMDVTNIVIDALFGGHLKLGVKNAGKKWRGALVARSDAAKAIKELQRKALHHRRMARTANQRYQTKKYRRIMRNYHFREASKSTREAKAIKLNGVPARDMRGDGVIGAIGNSGFIGKPRAWADGLSNSSNPFFRVLGYRPGDAFSVSDFKKYNLEWPGEFLYTYALDIAKTNVKDAVNAMQDPNKGYEVAMPAPHYQLAGFIAGKIPGEIGKKMAGPWVNSWKWVAGKRDRAVSGNLAKEADYTKMVTDLVGDTAAVPMKVYYKLIWAGDGDGNWFGYDAAKWQFGEGRDLYESITGVNP